MGMMNRKQKRERPRLERRNAIKNIEYEASNSSSSYSSIDDQLTDRTRPLDISPLCDCTSFRIEGIEGEFDRIWRSLGLSGPEDFAIPVAAWEACKVLSPSDRFPSSGIRDHYSYSESFGPQESGEIGLLDNFEAGDKINSTHEFKCEKEYSHLKNDLNSAEIEARLKVNNEVKREDGGFHRLNVMTNLVSRSGDVGGGIKGVRPPVLAPPPVMSPSVVDNVSSTWDIFRAFGPQDDEYLCSPVHVRPIDFSNEKDRPVKENENGARLGDTDVFSESRSDKSNDGRDEDSFRTVIESVYSISPNGKFRRSITSWQKGDFLGRGSFGTVYEGFTDDGFFFAVKEVSLLDQGSQGKQSIIQLEQEITLLSQFEHENIVQYLGTDKDDCKLYIFLELVTKGSLANLYQKYHLRDSQVSAYTRHILNGLNYLHQRNVVHRDIKCANILVDASGSVKLADFGLAKATKLNDVQSCKGTAFWMAPEVVNQKNHGYGLAADIWSLGCTVLEMLTRRIPYSHLEGMQALFRIGKGEPPPIPNSLSKDAHNFIMKCLQVNPDNRPTAAQLLDHPFVKKPLSPFSVPASPCVAAYDCNSIPTIFNDLRY